jgi:hypothetical protein
MKQNLHMQRHKERETNEVSTGQLEAAGHKEPQDNTVAEVWVIFLRLLL